MIISTTYCYLILYIKTYILYYVTYYFILDYNLPYITYESLIEYYEISYYIIVYACGLTFILILYQLEFHILYYIRIYVSIHNCTCITFSCPVLDGSWEE